MKPLTQLLAGLAQARWRPMTTTIGFGLLLSLSSGCGPGSGGAGRAATDNPPARSVRAALLEMRNLERVVPTVGALAAQDQATLSVKVAGRLQEIPVDLGSFVRKGDLIARMEPLDFELRLRQAEAQLAQARARLGLPLSGNDDAFSPDQTSTVRQAKALLEEATKNRERVARLTQEGVLSQSELETVTATYEVAFNKHQDAIEEVRNRQATLAQRRVEYEIARKQLDDTAIYAPFDGAIQERLASVGEYHPAGSPIVTLVHIDPLRLRVEVPEREAANVRLGQKVRLQCEGYPSGYTGDITRLSPAIREATRMLVVEADVKNDGRLRPGLFARAEIVTREDEPGLVAPRSALIAFAGVEKVFVIRGGQAVEKAVTTGRSGPDWVELLSGASAGDLAVLDPGNLQTGQAVTVATPSPSGLTSSPPAKTAAPGPKP